MANTVEPAARIEELQRQLAAAQAEAVELRARVNELTPVNGYWSTRTQQYEAQCPLCLASGSGDWPVIPVSHEANCPRVNLASALARPASTSALERALQQARAEERDACARACMNNQFVPPFAPNGSLEAYNRACEDCAQVIRERGKR